MYPCFEVLVPSLCKNFHPSIQPLALRAPPATVMWRAGSPVDLWQPPCSLPPLLSVSSASAQGRALRLVRDAETEELIRDYARPIFKAAGLKPGNIRIHLVNDSRFNAFVVDGKRMFINTGTIIQSKTPNEVIGVLAHETGHIAGGHLIRLRQAMKNAQTISAIGMLLGAGAAATGAAAGNADAAKVGGAIMTAAPGVATRHLPQLCQNRGNRSRQSRDPLS